MEVFVLVVLNYDGHVFFFLFNIYDVENKPERQFFRHKSISKLKG